MLDYGGIMAEDQGKNGEDQGGRSDFERPKGAFLCHSSKDSDFVRGVARFLKRNFEHVYYFEESPIPTRPFWKTIDDELQSCEVCIVFVKDEPTKIQIDEVRRAYKIHRSGKKRSFVFCLPEKENFPKKFEETEFGDLSGYPRVKTKGRITKKVAEDIMKELDTSFKYDGLPSNPHLFSYEKDIIKHFVKVSHLKGEKLKEGCGNGLSSDEIKEIHKKEVDGCPRKWPDVVLWDDKTRDLSEEYHKIRVDPKKIDQKVKRWKSTVGSLRKKDARVIVAALTDYHKPAGGKAGIDECCMVNQRMCFSEAGPREFLYFPRRGRKLKVAIMVSGGIAPGTNAVIDGIVQRHLQYAQEFSYVDGLRIMGIKNGFLAFGQWDEDNSREPLKPIVVNISARASEGGSRLGTSRDDDLLADSDKRWEKLDSIVRKLYDSGIDILYVIGGDGSMKAAHALWTEAQKYAKENKLRRNLSVVAIPKTMDNDILWVWQTFGFLSAVEKAREIIDHLATEVESNPRLCVAQLFGSDSGFVVSHAVLASRPKQCDAALIPEIDFTIKKLAEHLRRRMNKRATNELIRRGLVVMAETAIPLDAMDFVDEKRKNYVNIGLTDGEKKEIRKFEELRAKGKRIQGQTNDNLRSAGLKIASRGLHRLLENNGDDAPDSPKLRVVTNEPRHLLRALPPSCTDIIMGNRLGTLAVDNVLAGYTDFMISQWLTEYVLVPLELVVLGRKRIPKTGIFWKSVIAKTGQPAELS
jgi:6-phosphofructokinase 1